MIQTLVSVPPHLDAWLRSPLGRAGCPFGTAPDFIGSDPRGTRLGSGGGTVSLLHRQWLEKGRGCPFEEWLRSAQRLVLHAGGESRRLPAYAAIGKALLPVPFSPGRREPTRFDQVLADFQVSTYQQVLREAGTAANMMVASGDVWLDLDPLQIAPLSADVTGIGMRVTPEIAQHFGVFFVAKSGTASEQRQNTISFFLQKPSPAEIYKHASKFDFYVDTGLWLFSSRAVEFLFQLCGWSKTRQRFASRDDVPAYLDLYTEIGAALGEATPAPLRLRRHGWGALSRSVVALDQARFFHVGSSRQLLDSYEQLAGNGHQRQRLFSFATSAPTVANRSNLPVWVDGGHHVESWVLGGMNLVTGSAVGMGPIRLAPDQCLEIAPTGATSYVVRPYSVDDRFRGPADGAATICGMDARTWLERRGLPVKADDVFDLPLYPIVRGADITQELIEWFFADAPAADQTAKFHRLRRLSAAQIPGVIDFDRYFADRNAGHAAVLQEQFAATLATGDGRNLRQDFGAIARLAHACPALKRWLQRSGPKLADKLPNAEHRARVYMLLSEISRRPERDRFVQLAHAQLQQGVITAEQFPPCEPRLALKEDQIVWGRSPVRLDLAGGWTDTPPYCFEHGGTVLNVAVLLNGQPPIQVFVRPLPEPVLRLRSIDLGAGETITTYGELETFRDPRSGFSLPKAALSMAGFLPDFAAGRAAPTLRARLARFGGGLEISLLSAIPKGSGLGTSSILAATILGALNRACGLGWDEVGLYTRVLGVEQLLTTGGGWQDQAGALFRGIKLIETDAGPTQKPTVRYLPEHLFGPTEANRTVLLYYTGITRLAKGILKEIVHDMFLAEFGTLQTLALIRSNAHALFTAIQQNDAALRNRCIARSWDLNKRLDPGTSTPEIEEILRICGQDLLAAKLLGAGGGGYMLLCAGSPDAGDRIRHRLEQTPPNRRARFIDFEIAKSGLEVTVS